VWLEEEAIASKRGGKQVLGVDARGAAFCLEASGDSLAVVGDNGKALIFPLSELPEMPRGKGVKLQAYREGGLRDGLVFVEAEGPAWLDPAGRTRAWPDWRTWIGRRAGAGKLVPRGFPTSKRFRPRP
jgi:topoisomerase IV subunit A